MGMFKDMKDMVGVVRSDELEVQIPSEEPYTVVHRQAIALAAMGNWQAGKIWPVRVDPSDRTKVIVG